MKLKVTTEIDVRYCNVVFLDKYNQLPEGFPKLKENIADFIIDLETKKIINWNLVNKSFNLEIKLDDSGTYILLDSNMIPKQAKTDFPVPNKLLPGEYSKYLELVISEDGTIQNFLPSPNLLDFE